MLLIHNKNRRKTQEKMLYLNIALYESNFVFDKLCAVVLRE